MDVKRSEWEEASVRRLIRRPWERRILVINGSGESGDVLGCVLLQDGKERLSRSRRPDCVIQHDLPSGYSAAIHSGICIVVRPKR